MTKFHIKKKNVFFIYLEFKEYKKKSVCDTNGRHCCSSFYGEKQRGSIKAKDAELFHDARLRENLAVVNTVNVLIKTCEKTLITSQNFILQYHHPGG